MLGRLIVALLVIGAAAVVTMERETAEVADMTATLAESKYSDAEERAERYETRAKEAEAKVAELTAKNQWLETELAEATRLRELSLVPQEVRMTAPTTRGSLEVTDLLKVALVNADATRACFARAQKRGEDITMHWVIRTDGRVIGVSTNGAAVAGNETIVPCLTSEIAQWRFPPKTGSTLAQITWKTAAPAP